MNSPSFADNIRNIKKGTIDIISVSFQLREYLIKNCLAQSELAEIIGTTSVQINRWIMCRQHMGNGWQKFLLEKGILKEGIKVPEDKILIPLNKKGEEMKLPKKRGRPMACPVILNPVKFISQNKGEAK